MHCLINIAKTLAIRCKCMQAINRTVEVVECEYSRVDLVKLLGIEAFSLDKMLHIDPDFLKVCCTLESMWISS